MDITTINYTDAEKSIQKTDFANFIKSVSFCHPQVKNLLALWVDSKLTEYPAITSGYAYEKDDLSYGELWHVFSAYVQGCPDLEIFEHNIFRLTAKSGVITAKYKQ